MCAAHNIFRRDMTFASPCLVASIKDRVFCALFSSAPNLMDLNTRHRGRAAVSQLVRRERGDGWFLNGADLVWECTGVKMKVDNVHVIDGIGAVVSDRFYNQGADFLGIRLVPHSGGEFRIVGT